MTSIAELPSTSKVWVPIEDTKHVDYKDDLAKSQFVSLIEKTAEIYWLNPHAVNDRLRGAQDVESSEECNKLLDKFVKLYPDLDKYDFGDLEWKIRQLVYKNKTEKDDDAFELSIYDTETTKIEYYPLSTDEHTTVPMRIEHTWDGKSRITVQLSVLKAPDNNNAPSTISGHEKWLQGSFLPKWTNWLQNCSPESRTSKSLALVDLIEYNRQYTQLKKDYGKTLVDNWPERTSAQKFVYEDVAIVSYLAVYWKSTGDSNPTFCDLGCGNGLLVYLLNRVGFTGSGVDIRRRNIWDQYDHPIDLLETQFDPSNQHNLLPPVDWLIGNHSDELTPWIPVLAARMHCNYMILPCCPHDFYGKYIRTNNKSYYNAYLQYVRSIGETLDFDVYEDRLKIPSTRRICFIGRIKPKADRVSDVELEKRIQTLLDKSLAKKSIGYTAPKNGHGDTSDQSAFSVRAAVEPVRNCTRLPKEVIRDLLKAIIDYLLSLTDTKNDLGWSMGGEATLGQIAKEALTVELRQHLRQQDGGLQTLLRNHKHLFDLSAKGVKLRDYTMNPVIVTKMDPNNDQVLASKKYNCWFYELHPQGCVLSESDCPYKHVDMTE